MDISNDKIVERIFSLWDAGVIDDETIINKISDEFDVERSEAESVLELTQSGFLRANLISNGSEFPKSNLNSHPIVLSALRIGLNKLGYPELYEKIKNPAKLWWKFW